MRVLMISKTFVASTAQRKLEELARCPGVELTLVTPAYWLADDGSKQVFEPRYTRGYRTIVTPMMFNGHFHLYYYPRLGQIMREVRPEILHIDEEAYNFAQEQVAIYEKKLEEKRKEVRQYEQNASFRPLSSSQLRPKPWIWLRVAFASASRLFTG